MHFLNALFNYITIYLVLLKENKKKLNDVNNFTNVAMIISLYIRSIFVMKNILFIDSGK